jgi:nucleoside-diphosphate-sugar epimerase
MKILITGGAGYKGVLLVKALLDLGHDVILTDNFMYGYSSVLHLINHPRLVIQSLDVRNITRENLAVADIIFHLAGISSMPACAANPHSAEVINLHASKRLVSLLGKGQILVYASTTSIYGSAALECDEKIPVDPPSLYAKTKYEAEKIVMTHPIAISLRFATVFGVSPRMRADILVNDFTYKAVNERSIVLFGSRSKRTFMHLDDAVSAYLFALKNANLMRGGIYNVGDESLNFSKLDIATAIRKHIKFEIIDSSLPDLDARDFMISFKKIRELGYRTERTLDDGIKELLKLYSFFKVHSHFSVI